MARRFPPAGWFFVAATLFFLGLVGHGFHAGRLKLLGKGAPLVFERVGEPFGFWLLALFYLALAGLAGWVVWLCLRHGDDTPRAGNH